MPERISISRRLAILLGLTGAAAAGYVLTHDGKEDSPPENPEELLKDVEKLPFTKGSFLTTTVSFRKQAYENAKLQQLNGTWQEGEDESKWIDNPAVEEDIKLLAEAGFKSARLVIFPFEITEDGENYNWNVIEKALDLLAKYGMKADFCLGPVDYPYGPGIRLPKNIQESLKNEMEKNGAKNINISLNTDPNLPESSKTIKDWCLKFTQDQLKRYGNDERINKFYISNEWPDRHGIEGINIDGHELTMEVDQDIMMEITTLTKKMTSKKLAINTNIHPSNFDKIKQKLGPLLEIMGKQGYLGIDAYPTREEQDLILRHKMSKYDQYINQLRHAYPNTEIGYTEMQTEPWPSEDVAGDPWANIMQDDPQVMKDFYEEIYPKNIQKYIIDTKIKEINSWGAPALTIAYKMGYKLPLQIMKAMATQMEKNK